MAHIRARSRAAGRLLAVLAAGLPVACSPRPDAPEPARSAAQAPPPAAQAADTAAWQPVIGNQAGEQYLRAVQPYNLPPWAHARAEREGHTRTLVPVLRLNPFYQAGDFDGDGRLDVAVLVARRATGQQGVLLLHGGATPTALIGAGSEFGNGGADFGWMTNWTVRGAEPGAAAGDTLAVVKLESGGGLVYRASGAYHWRQFDD